MGSLFRNRNHLGFSGGFPGERVARPDQLHRIPALQRPSRSGLAGAPLPVDRRTTLLQRVCAPPAETHCPLRMLLRCRSVSIWILPTATMGTPSDGRYVGIVVERANDGGRRLGDRYFGGGCSYRGTFGSRVGSFHFSEACSFRQLRSANRRSDRASLRSVCGWRLCSY